MNMGRSRVAVTASGLLLVVLTMGALHSPATIRLATADLNGDGRPDVWEYSDRGGRPIRIVRDTNFDGRSDVEESYINGHLIRRESDRNFDDRVDLNEDFNSNTGEHVRSVVDADFDGTADLLILFANGRPVYSKWADRAPSAASRLPIPAATAYGRGASAALWSLDDPFSSTHRFQSDLGSEGSKPVVGILSSTVPTWPASPTHPHRASRPVRLDRSPLVSASISAATPRGPPTSRTLI
jgi:hypothetical protein